MEFLDKAILAYSEDHTTAESELLKKINRETHVHVARPRMLSGHLQGRFLSMISCMIRPKVVLEIGTYTGYSAICLAEGLAPGGKVITLESNEELEERTRRYLEESGFEKKIDFRIGNALQILPTIPAGLDLVFIDADKENYSNYLDLVIDKVNVGGYILADNVLWSGKVLDSKTDKDTRAILDFNKKVHDDKRMESILVPIRDGIMVSRKIGNQ